MSRWFFVPFVLVIALTKPLPVAAHSVHVFAYVEDSKIKGEGSLAGGRKVKNGDVTVLRKNDEKILLTSRTDENGQFVIPIEELGQQEPTDLIIMLDAGPGHRSRWQVKAEEFAAAAADEKDSGPSQPSEESGSKAQRPPYPPLKNILTGIISIIGLGVLIAWARKKGGAR